MAFRAAISTAISPSLYPPITFLESRVSELFRSAVETAFARLREEREATNAKRQAMRELIVRFKAECHGESIGNAIITADIVGNDLVLKIVRRRML